MKKTWILLGCLMGMGAGWAHADVSPAGIVLDTSGNPVVVPVVKIDTETVTPITSPTQTGSLANPWPSGYIYYTIPGLNMNLVTPWSAAIVAVGHDYIGKADLLQGYVPLASWWKITGIVGAGLDSNKNGSPLGGGMLNILDAQLGASAQFHLIVTGGYDFNGKHALAVLSPSVQFLK